MTKFNQIAAVAIVAIIAAAAVRPAAAETNVESFVSKSQTALEQKLSTKTPAAAEAAVQTWLSQSQSSLVQKVSATFSVVRGAANAVTVIAQGM